MRDMSTIGELEQHLADRGSSDLLLHRVARLPVVRIPFPDGTCTASADACAPRDLFGLVGRTVSHFRVDQPLGAGGMGVVYRAEDTRLGRAVALKFLLPQFGFDSAVTARFLQEARAAATLDHPNVCTVLEMGETEDGWLFLAMPLYLGETLKTRLTRGVLPLPEAVEITRQIATGLAHAHAAGVIHRDVKPENVLVTPAGVVKLLDFGLAKVRELSLTGPGAMLGTAAYMAPEQLGDAGVDARVDLWALGVVLYQMLAGRRPFDREREVAVFNAIAHEEPASLSTVRDDLPAALVKIVVTLLRKDPARRYQTAEELLIELAKIRRSAEQPSPATERSQPWLPVLPTHLAAQAAWPAVTLVSLGVVAAVLALAAWR